MSFIDQNANFGLIVLIGILAISLVTITLYYQDKFQDINGQLTKKMDELNSTAQELGTAKATLEKTAKDLGIKAVREEDLSGRFLEKKGEAEQLGQKASELEETNKRLSEDLKNKESEISDLKSSVASKQSRIDELNTKIDDLKKQLGQ